jgi:hypothetical protein
MTTNVVLVHSSVENVDVIVERLVPLFSSHLDTSLLRKEYLVPLEKEAAQTPNLIWT